MKANYDGSKPIVHTIKNGESLSKIAYDYTGKYDFWKAIYNYNTKINHKKVLGNDPDLIYPNINIIIPRSKKGYDDLIVYLKKLYIQEEHALDVIRINEEHQKNAIDMFSFLVDTTADIATAAVTTGRKAASYLGSAFKYDKAAKAAKGSVKAANEYLAKNARRKYRQVILEDIVYDKAADHLIENGIDYKAIANILNDPAFNKYIKTNDNISEDDVKEFFKSLKKHYGNAKKVGKNMPNYLLSGKKGLGMVAEDAIEIAFSYLDIKPSKLAEKLIGQTNKDSYKSTMRYINQSEKNLRIRRDKHINRVLKEKQIVFGMN